MTDFTQKPGVSVWITRLERLSAWGAVAFLTLTITDILFGIFQRYITGSSMIWTEEVARFSLLWLVMLGACGAFLHGDHMTIDFVIKKLPLALQKLASQLLFVITAGILCLMIYLSYQNAMGMSHMKTMALNIPKTYPLLSIPVGFFFLLIAVVFKHLSFASSHMCEDAEKEVSL